MKVWIITNYLILIRSNGYVFNFVPGLEAVLLALEGREVKIELEVFGK